MCFFVLATVVLRNAVFLEFWPGFGWASERSRFFMTLFFGILQLGLFEFYFSSFGLVLSGIGIIVCVCYVWFLL